MPGEYMSCEWMTFSEALDHYLSWRDIKEKNLAGWKQADEQMALAAARMDQLAPVSDQQ